MHDSRARLTIEYFSYRTRNNRHARLKLLQDNDSISNDLERHL